MGNMMSQNHRSSHVDLIYFTDIPSTIANMTGGYANSGDTEACERVLEKMLEIINGISNWSKLVNQEETQLILG
ncbi:BnaC08g40380D [Brassica napus]|uniref:BnaC08g40380D protein n=1 Tax=Brassica napus TaxID=3708 RepID=A0A078FNS6_BRANA|nr:BnaC08g40380D [Brassica napus]